MRKRKRTSNNENNTNNQKINERKKHQVSSDDEKTTVRVLRGQLREIAKEKGKFKMVLQGQFKEARSSIAVNSKVTNELENKAAHFGDCRQGALRDKTTCGVEDK